MRWIFAIAVLALGCAGGAATTADDGLLGAGLLGPARRDAYGPGLNSDATGRPFEWRTRDGETVRGGVRPNAYGLGVGMDAYGRPVYAEPR